MGIRISDLQPIEISNSAIPNPKLFMLAYVFWHVQRPTVDRSVYISNLRAFHETLNCNKPSGFHYSVVFESTGVDWLGAAASAFADWYLIEDFASLGVLNEAAVTGVCQNPHNVVAKDAADGIAGLYRLQLGDVSFSTKRDAVWFSKPAGVTYKDFFSRMQTICSKNDMLWQRQMTLGPTAEFCLLSETESAIPKEIEGKKSQLLQLIWSGA